MNEQSEKDILFKLIVQIQAICKPLQIKYLGLEFDDTKVETTITFQDSKSKKEQDAIMNYMKENCIEDDDSLTALWCRLVDLQVIVRKN